MEEIIVLGLSLNTRMLGLAVISGNCLVDYLIRLRKEAWTPQKRESILASLQPCCVRYCIKRVALSMPYEKQTTKENKLLLQSVKRYFRKKKIILKAYHPKTIHMFCEKEGPRTKREAMRILAQKYPELLVPYQKEITNKNKYYIKLFEAVAVATIHARKLRVAL